MYIYFSFETITLNPDQIQETVKMQNQCHKNHTQLAKKQIQIQISYPENTAKVH